MNTEKLEKANKLAIRLKMFNNDKLNYEILLEHVKESQTEILDNNIKIIYEKAGFDRRIIHKSLALKILFDIISFYESLIENDEAEFNNL